MTIRRHIQTAALGARVFLYIIDLSDFGLGVIRLTPAPEEGGGGMVGFGGQPFAPHPIAAEGFDLRSGGTLPRPKLTVGNVDNSFTAMVEANDDLHGGRVTRIRTYGRYLDSGEEPDGDAHLPLDVFEISRKIDHTDEQIAWELRALMDQEGTELPGRVITQDHCDHRVRVWNPVAGAFDYTDATCPYAGAPKDENGDACAGIDEVFSKRLETCCKARFGANAVLPTRAFPGVARIALR